MTNGQQRQTRNDSHHLAGLRSFRRRALCATVAATAALPVHAQSAPAACQRPAPPPTVEPPRVDSLALASFDTAVRIIARTHFDSAYNGVPWQALADSLRPEVAAAMRRDVTRRAIRTMLERLRQSHFALFDAEPPVTSAREETVDGELGLDVRWIDGRVVVSHVDAGGPAARAGVRPGVSLVAVDGCPLTPAVSTMMTRTPAALVPLRAVAIGRDALEPREAGAMRLTIDTGRTREQLATVAVQPARLPRQRARLGGLGTVPFDVESRVAEVAGRRIGVLRFSIWVPAAVAAIDSAVDRLRTADGIVIDLRGNGGGVGGMVMGLGGHFIDSVVSLGTMRQRGATLRFVTNPRRVSVAGLAVQPYAGPVAILVDPLSLSTSEVFAGGMQAVGRARIFGEVTGGMALPAFSERLPNGDLLYHAVADFVDADGRRLEGSGVVPDVLVTPTRAALLDGRDPVYDRAVEWLTSAARLRSAGSPRQ
ncbi:MAG: S41 family peptidase [Gemmatimonadaceae bacterium]|jgi:carboxyl-terminal processing protease|nr:S41 family peptidase [Gemmatimonadaceae bacterium]